MEVLSSLFTYGEINRSGDNRHWKDSLLQVGRRQSTTHYVRPPGEATGLVKMQKKQREKVGKSLSVVFAGKNERSRLSKLSWFGNG